MDPLNAMKLRSAGLASALGASFGAVRNWSTSQAAYTRNHQGWDLDAPVGTVCYAIEDGVVEDIRSSTGGYGLELILRFSRSGNAIQSSPEDTLFASYAHLSNTLVPVGATVRAGDPIALTGVSGNASPGSPHLHLEIRTFSGRRSGMDGRLDPATILGYHHLHCS